MILAELRDFLKQRRRVALGELASQFDVDADALRGMMQRWLNKGQVRKLSKEPACGTGCCQCDPALTEIYEWVGE